MEELKVYIWQVMLHELKNNKITTQTVKKIFSVYARGVITDRQIRKWFSKLRFCERHWENNPEQ